VKRHVKASSAGPNSARGETRRLAALLFLVCAFGLLLAPSAFAEYLQLGGFADNGPEKGGKGSANGQLSNPNQADVNRSSKKLYVADTDNDRVEVFRSTATGGTYDSMVTIPKPTGLAIDQSTGVVYVANAAGVSKYTAALTPILAPAWQPPAATGALAVDPITHDLLVADRATKQIRRYSSNGTPGATFSVNPDLPIDIDVNSAGKIFVVAAAGDFASECTSSTVKRFSSAGVFEANIGESLGIAGAVAIDPDDDSIAIATNVNEYWCAAGNYPEVNFLDPSGALVESAKLIGPPDPEGEPNGDLFYAMVPSLVAVGGHSSRVYAITRSPVNDEFGNTRITAYEDLTPPDVAIDPVDSGSVSATEATFSGSVDPNGVRTNWRFEYRVVGSLEWRSSPPQSADVGPGPQPVSFQASNLEADRQYEVRLLAASIIGTFESPLPNPAFTTDLSPPMATTLAAGAVRPTEALIRGQVNPRNAQTEYWFEWGTADCVTHACTSVPVSQDADAGSGHGTLDVARKITGLSLETTYYFRLVAKNASGTTEGDSLTFTTPATTVSCPNSGAIGVGFLPDCRAWEMVSPPSKNGGEVIPTSVRTRAASDGSALSFVSLQGFGDAAGTGLATDYVTQRSGDLNPGNNGWLTHSVTPRQDSIGVTLLAGGEPAYQGVFSDDLSTGVYFGQSVLTDEDPNVVKVNNLYLRNNLRNAGTGSYRLITACPACSSPLSPSVSFLPPSLFRQLGRPNFTGASEDFGHLSFESTLKLADGASQGAPLPNSPNAYEWVNGTVRFAGVLPDGNPASPSAVGRNSGGISLTYSAPAVSADGSTLIFTAPPLFEVGGGYIGAIGSLYARIEGRSTVQLNVSERGQPDTPKPASFADISRDGSRVFLTSFEALTDDAPVSVGNEKLYMWKRADSNETQEVAVNAAAGSFTLSFHEASTAPIAFDASAASVKSALEALPTIKAGNVAVTGGPGSVGANHPYAITFTGDFAGVNVAQLSADDAGLSGGSATATVSDTHPVENLTCLSVDFDTVFAEIAASEEGDYVYFSAAVGGVTGVYLWHEGKISHVGGIPFSEVPSNVNGQNVSLVTKQSYASPDGRHLLFSSTSGAGMLSVHGGIDYNHAGHREIYLYSADANELDCVSCNPSGAPAEADAATRTIGVANGGSFNGTYQSRQVSADGRYAYFSTAERLVAEDTNGLSDAYLYDNASDEAHLLSGGEDSAPSYFLEASEDGKDAFFATREPLSHWDTDRAYDIYDARVDGGFPEPPLPPPGCTGDACQPPSSGLNDPTPSSASFYGSGNSNSKRTSDHCPKGKRRVKKGKEKARCIRRSAKATRGKAKRSTDQNRRASR
jgi:hypothetical protein